MSLETTTAIGDVIARRYRVENCFGHYVKVRDIATGAKRSIVAFDAPVRLVSVDPGGCSGMIAAHEVVTEGARYYLVTEPLEGLCLADILSEQTALEVDSALAVIGRILAILEALHSTGCTYGTLSAGAVFVDETLRGLDVKLLPAFISDGDDGSPYLPPERDTHPRARDPRTDLFAAGVLLHLMVTGRFPNALPPQHDADVRAHSTQTPRQLNPLIWPALEAFLLKAYAAAPNDRYQTAEEMHTALLALELGIKPSLSPFSAGMPAPMLDENVQFTVFRPSEVRPARRYPLLAFAHLSENPPDAPDSEVSPIERVQRQAEAILGDRLERFREITQDADQAVPKGGEITFLPEIPGVTFEPPRHTFKWDDEEVHLETFFLTASIGVDGKTQRGTLTVYIGAIILAEIRLVIRVDSRAELTSETPPAPVSVRPYRNIFASYSHEDLAIVEQCEALAKSLGDRYLRDCVDIRAGEKWSDKLREMIRRADVFQLFWSWNAMRSSYVRQEWEYALSLCRDGFVRPTYWEVPLPMDEARGLPPSSLRSLHFQQISTATAGTIPSPSSEAPSATSDDTRGTVADIHTWRNAPAPAMHRTSTLRRITQMASVIAVVFFCGILYQGLLRHAVPADDETHTSELLMKGDVTLPASPSGAQDHTPSKDETAPNNDIPSTPRTDAKTNGAAGQSQNEPSTTRSQPVSTPKTSHPKRDKPTPAITRVVDELRTGGGRDGIPRGLTSVDRTREKKTVPETGHRVETPSRSAPKSDSDVIAGMEEVAPEVKKCGGGRGGTIAIRVTIGKNGRVTDAAATEAFAGSTVGACAVEAVKKARFKSRTKSRTLVYPFLL